MKSCLDCGQEYYFTLRSREVNVKAAAIINCNFRNTRQYEDMLERLLCRSGPNTI